MTISAGLKRTIDARKTSQGVLDGRGFNVFINDGLIKVAVQTNNETFTANMTQVLQGNTPK